MGAYLNVATFFSSIYLVDLSPSLCEVARKRFERLGWDVQVVCQDARSFRLEEHVKSLNGPKATVAGIARYSRSGIGIAYQADLITMSYSLSMIPDYYSVVDSLTELLAPSGLIGVVDFYVQSIVETAGRNYIGGSFNRHVNWLSRVIWRSWFDCDRVGLEGARRVSVHIHVLALRTALDFMNRTIWNIGSEPRSPSMRETICWEEFLTISFWAPAVSCLSQHPICWNGWMLPAPSPPTFRQSNIVLNCPWPRRCP